jgi:UDPglucose 6-dehydrogenase
MKEAQRRIGDRIAFMNDQYETLIDADCLMIATEWPEFKFPNFNVIKKLLRQAVVFDGRNIYDRFEMKRLGFDYYCIGIDTSRPEESY